jgi:hypothetical protein
VQLIDHPDEQSFFVAPGGAIRITVDCRMDLLRRQGNPLGEERDVHTPLVCAPTARASAVDHDLAVAKRDWAAVEKAASAKSIPNARHTGQRSEQHQWRDAGRHDGVKHFL